MVLHHFRVALLTALVAVGATASARAGDCCAGNGPTRCSCGFIDSLVSLRQSRRRDETTARNPSVCGASDQGQHARLPGADPDPHLVRRNRPGLSAGQPTLPFPEEK